MDLVFIDSPQFQVFSHFLTAMENECSWDGLKALNAYGLAATCGLDLWQRLRGFFYCS